MANGKGYPQIILTEEGMRDGLQIEDANIPVDQKVALLDALSETGLKRIVVGSFVSPKYTPQMKHIDEIMHKFHPKPGVTYLALALNAKGVERSQEYSPPLTIERSNGWVRGRPKLFCHMCDVFIRRNTNRSQFQEMASWPATIAAAMQHAATTDPRPGWTVSISRLSRTNSSSILRSTPRIVSSAVTPPMTVAGARSASGRNAPKAPTPSAHCSTLGPCSRSARTGRWLRSIRCWA